jgi:hypothetical protein
MNMELKSDTPASAQKVYDSIAVAVGTFIGGPLAAGYFIAENFKVFNQSGKAGKTWIAAVAAMILIFCAVIFVPENVTVLNPVVLLIIAVIVWFLAVRFQGKNISAHISSGGQLYNWWRTLAVALASLAVTIIFILGIALLLDVFTKSSVTFKTYGVMKNEIAFDKNNLSEIEVDELGDAFINASYFNESGTKFVFAKKLKEGFELSLAVPDSLAVDSTAMRLFRKLKIDMQGSFPDKKIGVNLVVGDLKNVIKHIE